MIKILTKNPNSSYEVQVSTFPGGEEYVKLPENLIDCIRENSGITLRIKPNIIKSSSDLIRTLLTLDALVSLWEVEGTAPLLTTLVLPYLPYARQDRVCKLGESFSLRWLFGCLNNYKHIVDTIEMVDAHSFDAVDSLSEIPVVNLTGGEACGYELKVIEDTQVILAPDNGAVDRATRVANQFEVPVAYATKTREEGKVVCHLEPEELEKIKGKRVLIVDDICDGGGTFLALGKIVKPYCSELSLLVTHGIFCKDAKTKLTQYYDNVYAHMDWTTQ